VQKVAAEAHVVLEQVVCYKPDIIHEYETLQICLVRYAKVSNLI